MTRAQREIYFIQDDCLIDIADGKKINETKLRKLPPWRAVLIAKVAVQAKAMTQEAYDKLVDQAAEVGGEGRLPDA
jgi:hypothetical protein